MAMSLVNGGSGYPYMAVPMYRYLCGGNVTADLITTADIPNMEVRQLVQKVGLCTHAGYILQPIYKL